MSIADPNPYAPPQTAPVIAPCRPNPWRLIPAAVLFLAGSVSFAYGVFAVGLLFYVGIFEDGLEDLDIRLVASLMYVGLGSAWILAGRSFWMQRYRTAWLATLVGVAIPTVLIAVLNF